MSETYDNEARLFESLAAQHMDPMLQRVFDEIQVYNEMLVDEPIDKNEINQIMNELDRKWYLTLDEQATFSGFATFPDPSTGVEQREYYDDKSVIFQGVLPHQDEMRNLARDVDEDPLYYQLRLSLRLETIDSDGKLSYTPGTATVEDVISLEIANAMSFERAQYILENNCPDLLEDIDIALLSDGEEESEAAARLRGLSYATIINDEQTHKQVNKALDRYMVEVVEFDKFLGYHLKAKGPAWLIREGVTFECDINFTAPLLVESLVWCKSLDEDDTIVPCLLGRMHNEEVNDISDLLVIPLTSVEEFQSLRFQYYTSD